MEDNKSKSINEIMIEAAVASAQTAINDSIASGVPLAVWRDGKVVDVTPEELQQLKLDSNL